MGGCNDMGAVEKVGKFSDVLLPSEVSGSKLHGPSRASIRWVPSQKAFRELLPCFSEEHVRLVEVLRR